MTAPPTRSTRSARPGRGATSALALALGTALASLFLTAAPASAHAALVSSDPADGARVDRVPDDVTLTFSEDVREPAFVAVTTADGTDVTAGRVAIDGTDVTRGLDTGTAGGVLTVAYRVVSADGHPIEGELTFTAPATPAEEEASPEPQASEGAAGESTGPGAAESPTESPTTADTEPAAQQTASEEGFFSQYGVALVVALVVAAAVAALLVASRRRGRA